LPVWLRRCPPRFSWPECFGYRRCIFFCLPQPHGIRFAETTNPTRTAKARCSAQFDPHAPLEPDTSGPSLGFRWCGLVQADAFLADVFFSTRAATNKNASSSMRGVSPEIRRSSAFYI